MATDAILLQDSDRFRLFSRHRHRQKKSAYDTFEALNRQDESIVHCR